MTRPVIVGAVLRVDLRGFSGDLPARLGAPMSEDPMRDGTRALFYDLARQVGDGILDEACARLAVFFDRHFVDEQPFEGAFAKQMKLELGLMVSADAESWSLDLPAHLLDALAAMEAGVGLTFYPQQVEDDAVQEDI
ncbi:MAG: hypothetical protein JWO64_973 [Hyphomicrobiales bacterium]|nr:hypothetical protein [Hyphomicrobiales bacterium]